MTELIEEATKIKPVSVLGFNGYNLGGMVIHPDCEHIIYHLGYLVVVENITTKKQTLLFGHRNDVSCLAVSKSGKYVASGQIIFMGFKADIIVWDYAKKDIYCRFTLHKVKVQALHFSPNDLFLLSLGGQDDGNVVVWNIKNKEAVCGSPAQPTTAGRTLCCRFTQTNDYSFITGGEFSLRIWSLDVKNRKIRPTEVNLGIQKRIVNCLDIENDDSFVYCGTTTGDIMCVIIKTATLASIGPPKKLFPMGIQNLCHITTGGQLLYLVGAGDGTLAVLKDRHNKFRQTKNVIKLDGSVTSISLRGPGQQLFVGTSRSNIYRFNFAEFSCILLNTGHSSAINDITFPHNTSDLFLTCGHEDIRVWHAPSAKEMLRITVANMTCNALDISHDGSIIISAWNDGRIRAHYPETGKLMFQIENAHNRGVTSIAFSEDSKRIISGGGEGQVRVWLIKVANTGRRDIYETSLIESMKEHKGCVTQIKLFPNGLQCVSVSTDGTCIIWNLENYQRDAVIFANTLFQCACIYPDNCQIITSGTDRNVAYWEVTDATQIRELEGAKSGSINAMDISKDGKYFITGGGDHLVKVWLYEEGIVTNIGVGHGGNIKRLRISPDQKFIISVGEEGAILRWESPFNT